MFLLVQWAGKTIALGTFPSAEADEKCARAKALTRAWRSTMRPKPSREWVMLELERLQVRYGRAVIQSCNICVVLYWFNSFVNLSFRCALYLGV